MISKIFTTKHVSRKSRASIAGAGFTLIETLVAVLILTTAVAAPLTVASRGLLTSLVAKDQITAYYLAQDAVEYIRFKRDTACLPLSTAAVPQPCNSSTWLSGIGGSSGPGGCESTYGCILDSTGNNTSGGHDIDPCTSGVGSLCTTPLLFSSSLNRFTYDSTLVPTPVQTIFTRTVKLSAISQTEEKVTVTVAWFDLGGTTRQVVISEDLFNWE